MATTEILVFEVNGSVCGVNIANVVEITTATAVTTIPATPDEFEGVCSSRGTIIPVLNLYKILHKEQRNDTKTMFVTCSYDNVTVAFRTGKVYGIRREESDSIIAPPKMLYGSNNSTTLLVGVVPTEQLNILLLDLKRVLQKLGLDAPYAAFNK